jgi:hypothetical protein
MTTLLTMPKTISITTRLRNTAIWLLIPLLLSGCQMLTPPTADRQAADQPEQRVEMETPASSALAALLGTPTENSPSLAQLTQPPHLPTTTPSGGIPVLVYFTSISDLQTMAVTRSAPPTVRLPDAVLREFFRGPYDSERAAGLEAVLNGFTGYSTLTIENNLARVYLTGTCLSNGASYTIAQPLMANLLQFEDIQFIKIYDENGSTENPDGLSNSIPACLEP